DLRSCHRSPRATGGWRRLSALRLRTTSDHVTARLGRPAATAAFPPCGCARPPIMSPLASGDRRLAPPFRPAAAHDRRSCHRSPRATGGYRRLSALRLRTTPIMSPLASGDRRLAPPFRPAAAHDSDHVTARLGRPAAGAAFPPCGCARPPIMSPLASGDRRLAPPL